MGRVQRPDRTPHAEVLFGEGYFWWWETSPERVSQEAMSCVEADDEVLCPAGEGILWALLYKECVEWGPALCLPSGAWLCPGG